MNEPFHDIKTIGKNDFLHEGFRVHIAVTSTVDDEGNTTYTARRADGTPIEGCERTNEVDCIRAAREVVHETLKKA